MLSWLAMKTDDTHSSIQKEKGRATVLSTVYTHGENGFPCIRIPSTLALPFDVPPPGYILLYMALF